MVWGPGLAAVLDRVGHEGRLLLLLDGLDEVPREERGEAEGLLRQLSSRWPKTPLVVSSRPIGYQRPDSDFRELQLLPFDRERRREFLARWFGDIAGKPDWPRAEREAQRLESHPTLRDLAGNPLYLTLMALLVEQGTSPDRQRTGLYDQVFQLLLDGGHSYLKAEPMDAQEAVRKVLRHLAREMTRDNRDGEAVTELEARLYKPKADALREPLERVPRWRRSMRPFLEDLAERTGILGPHDGPNADWRYWHRTFREALAAEALEEKLRSKDGEAALLEEARQIAQDDLSRWAEPYALLAGRVRNPDTLVEALVRENRELGLRALATAQGLADETVYKVLDLSEKWEERAKVYKRLPELVDDPLRVLALVDQWAQARLPTEEEWEYACRAGTQTRFWSGDKETDLQRVDWFRNNSGDRIHRVGAKESNPWGLYDLHGNVWEWTLSHWIDDYRGREDGIVIDSSQLNPEDFARKDTDSSGIHGVKRVFRGGAFGDKVRWSRSAVRVAGKPGSGIRGRGFRVIVPTGIDD